LRRPPGSRPAMTSLGNPVSIWTPILSRRSRNRNEQPFTSTVPQIWITHQYIFARSLLHRRVQRSPAEWVQATRARPAPLRILWQGNQRSAPERTDRNFVSWCLCGETKRFESRTIAAAVSPANFHHKDTKILLLWCYVLAPRPKLPFLRSTTTIETNRDIAIDMT